MILNLHEYIHEGCSTMSVTVGLSDDIKSRWVNLRLIGLSAINFYRVRVQHELMTPSARICGREGKSLSCLLSPWKINNIFNLVEVSITETSIVAVLSLQFFSIVGHTNILSNPPFHVGHCGAIY